MLKGLKCELATKRLPVDSILERDEKGVLALPWSTARKVADSCRRLFAKPRPEDEYVLRSAVVGLSSSGK